MSPKKLRVIDKEERLDELEAVIEEGLASFVAGELAFKEIKEQRLYVGPFSTFEEYCMNRWGFEQGHVKKLTKVCQALGRFNRSSLTRPSGTGREALGLVERDAPVQSPEVKLKEAEPSEAETVRVQIHGGRTEPECLYPTIQMETTPEVKTIYPTIQMETTPEVKTIYPTIQMETTPEVKTIKPTICLETSRDEDR